jgi:hypothetical protein
LLLVSAQPVAAFKIVTASGTYGMFHETDTEAHPGAHCFYHAVNAADQNLYKIKIPAPRILASDRTSKRDHQKVGWQYVIQRGKAAGDTTNWVTVYKSLVVKGTAYEDTAAPFTYRVYPVNFVNRWWRVEIVMFWYHPGSSTMVDGKVKLLVENYKITYPPNPDTQQPTGCLPGE